MDTSLFSSNDFRNSVQEWWFQSGFVIGKVVTSPSQNVYGQYQKVKKPSDKVNGAICGDMFASYVHNNLDLSTDADGNLKEWFGTRRVLQRKTGSVLSRSSQTEGDHKRTMCLQYKNMRHHPNRKWWVLIRKIGIVNDAGDYYEEDETTTFKCYGNSKEWEKRDSEPGQYIWSWSTLFNTTLSMSDTHSYGSPFINFSLGKSSRKAFIPLVGDFVILQPDTGKWSVVSKECIDCIAFLLSNENIKTCFSKFFSNDTYNPSTQTVQTKNGQSVKCKDYISKRLFESPRLQTDPYGLFLTGLYLNCSSFDEVREALASDDRIARLNSMCSIGFSRFEIEYPKSPDFYKAMCLIGLCGDIPTVNNYPQHDTETFNNLSRVYPFPVDRWLCDPSLINRALETFNWASEQAPSEAFIHLAKHKKFYSKFTNNSDYPSGEMDNDEFIGDSTTQINDVGSSDSWASRVKMHLATPAKRSANETDSDMSVLSEDDIRNIVEDDGSEF